MARRRMYSQDVVSTDRFLDLPLTAQALYFHLGLNADDDGFCASPRKITRCVGANADDLKLLCSKGFTIPFSSGVIVITDWKLNNSLRSDRYTPTAYQAEKKMLAEDIAGKYSLVDAMATNGIPMVDTLEPQVSIGEVSIEEVSIGQGDMAGKPPAPTRKKFVPPTVEQVAEYCQERKNNVDPQGFVDFYAAKGWLVGRTPMKDWKAAVRNAESWERWNKPRGGTQYTSGGDRLAEMIKRGDFDD